MSEKSEVGLAQKRLQILETTRAQVRLRHILDAAALSKSIQRIGPTSAARPSPAMLVERRTRPGFVCVPLAYFQAAQPEGALSCFGARRRSVNRRHWRAENSANERDSAEHTTRTPLLLFLLSGLLLWRNAPRFRLHPVLLLPALLL